MVKLLKFLSRSRSRNVQVEPFQTVGVRPDDAVSSAGLRASSRLLNDVLLNNVPGSAGTPVLLPARGAGPAVQPVPVSERLNIGVKLGDAKQTILEQASKLASISGEATQRILSQTANSMERLVCRVAFVGQMNAGKSSLINALVEEGELLPSDINPWTAVVTNLYFGVPGAPESGAAFTFFSADEWQRLSEGGRVRQLTERNFPGFDWDLLNAQIDAMKERARQKAGADFNGLLGGQHRYPALFNGLLSRYVGAGGNNSETSGKGLDGQYSDITKLAEVFFGPGPFSFPTILIDTPGVNDPFLVRDAITRQSLDGADVCVVVITARQPLSGADLSLLRMLRGLDKGRLIVFINKIDEIDTSGHTLRDVRDRVAAVLANEFPSSSIRVVLGSALWAHRSASAKAAAERSGDGDAGSPQLDRDMGTSRFPVIPLHDSGTSVQDDALLSRSGLPSLALAISELMRDGPTAESIGSAGRLLEGISRNSIAFLSAKASIISKFFADPDGASADLNELGTLRSELSACLDGAEHRLRKECIDEKAAIGTALREEMTAYIDSYFAAESGQLSLAKLRLADVRLRLRLETIYLDAYAKAEEALQQALFDLSRQASALFAEHRLMRRFSTVSGAGSAVAALPSLAALSEPVSIGQATSLKELEETLSAADDVKTFISNAIVADFEPIAARLADEAYKALRAACASALDETKALLLFPLENVVTRLAETFDNANGPAALDREDGYPASALTAEIEATRSDIDILTGIAAALSQHS